MLASSKESIRESDAAHAASGKGLAMPMNKKMRKRSFPHLTSIVGRIGDEVRYDALITTKLHSWHKDVTPYLATPVAVE